MQVRYLLSAVLAMAVLPAGVVHARQEASSPGQGQIERALPEDLPEEASDGVIQTPPEQESVIPGIGGQGMTAPTEAPAFDDAEDPVHGLQPEFHRDVLPAPDLQELPPPEANPGEEPGEISDLVPESRLPAPDGVDADTLPAPDGEWRSEGTDELDSDIVPRENSDSLPQDDPLNRREPESDLGPDVPDLTPEQDPRRPLRRGLPAEPHAPPGQRWPGAGLPGEVEETETVVPQPGTPEDRRFEVFLYPEPEGERLWEDHEGVESAGSKVEGGFGFDGPM